MMEKRDKRKMKEQEGEKRRKGTGRRSKVCLTKPSNTSIYLYFYGVGLN